MSAVSVEPCHLPAETAAMREMLPIAPIGLPPRDLALVIPTLYEAQILPPLLTRIRTALDGTGIRYEILVVDDDSRDGTEELVSTIARQDPRVRLLVRRGERGLAGAILHGWQQTDAAILGVMDADLQHPPELLPKLLAEVLNGHDLAIGSRYSCGGGVGEWNPLRKLISAVAVWVTIPLQHRSLRVKDPMSGFFMVRRACVEREVFQPTGFKLLLEILVRGRVHSVREVPFTFGRRCAGCSKTSLKVAWQYLQLLAKLYATRWRSVTAVQEAAGD